MDAQFLSRFIVAEALPESYAEDARRWLLPTLAELTRQQSGSETSIMVGINGAQGTGKSTLSALAAGFLAEADLRVAVLSIDDFYLSHSARQDLADSVHPLLASRGVPGTHDVPLLNQTLKALAQAGRVVGALDSVALPRFDKSVDDCVPQAQWPRIPGPVDVIILEGWFVGVAPQAESKLLEPINKLEREEDRNGSWRRLVNQRLHDYQPAFAALDRLLMLRAPSFDQVFDWRRLQEEKLRARSAADARGLMDTVQLHRFIEHFERLTRHCLATLPARADVVWQLDAEHRIAGQEGQI